MNSLNEMLEVYNEYWKNTSDFWVMPNTIRARTYLKKNRDISVVGILDNDEKQDGEVFNGIPIAYAKSKLASGSKKKILVSAHYREISEQLNALGYVEFEDYIDMHTYFSLWYWLNKKEIHLLDVHTAITTYCSLNCANCNMFLNYYKAEQRRHISFDEFQEEYNTLFMTVDFCYKVTILGGEPFLNAELPKMLIWLNKSYSKKIGEINIVTNGTVMPSSELIKAIESTKSIVQISNYNLGTKYEEKIKELESCLRKSGIQFNINRQMQWKDFYFPSKQQIFNLNSLREHMLCCNPVFRGLNDKKFYYCHILWSAEQAGLWTPQKDRDFIKLDNVKTIADKEVLLAYDLGFVEKDYVSLCRVCGGCGVDNVSVIEAGVQQTRKF